jgi:TRAP transporter TAXI family solute receptor
MVIYGSQSGGSSYIISAGIADLINKNSTWLRASVEATIGSNDDILKGADDPTLRKAALRMASNSAYFDALDGNKPFPKKITDLKAVFFQMAAPGFFVSIKPDIAKKEDLVGKKLVIGQELSAVRQFSEFIIRDCWGMWDQIKPQPMGWNDGSKAVLDGLADGIQAVTSLGAKGEWLSHPSYAEIVASRESYIMGPTEAEVAAGNKKANRSYGYTYIPAGALGKNQKNGAGSFNIMNEYYVYPEVPDDVVAEILRIVYEQNDKLGGYHAVGKGLTRERLGWLSSEKSTAEVHPVAIKFFQEKKIPLVLAGGADPGK